MGIYINPKDKSKEQWLEENAIGTLMYSPPSSYDNGEDLLVCLVVNIGFTAAAICTNQHEFEAFNDPSDLRIKIWLWVPKENLKPFM